jgi:hypothetical protein
MSEAERCRRALKWVLKNWCTAPDAAPVSDFIDILETNRRYGGRLPPEDIGETLTQVAAEIYLEADLDAEHAG